LCKNNLRGYGEMAHMVFDNNDDEESAVTKFTDFLKELCQTDTK
jgi:hypothetical protein